MIKLIIGDIRKVYEKIPDNSIDCIITSPPYYKQRDYGIIEQIGWEDSIEEYAKEIANVFKLLYNKIKKTGTIFLNMGYKYEGEELILAPELTAIEMKKVGYVLKNKIIWKKPNAMPIATRRRLNNVYEAVLFFIKDVGKEVYYFNLSELSNQSKNLDILNGKNHNLLSALVEDKLTYKVNRKGIVVNHYKNQVAVKWDDGSFEFFEVLDFQIYANFKCLNCEKTLEYWDIFLSYANNDKFICHNCSSKELPIPQLNEENENLPISNLMEYQLLNEYSEKIELKSNITGIKGSKKYKVLDYLTSSPAGRIAKFGEKLILKRKYIFPQPLIADYLKTNIKKANLKIEYLDKIFGYKHTAGHWIRKDFNYWGKGGSLPRPSDWIKLKEILNFDDRYDLLMTKTALFLSTIKTHPIKNIGDVWEIPTEPYSDNHFAVFPRKLVEICIKIGCPKNGIVLDPFAGSGTVGEIAKSLDRKAILVEINEEYKDLIIKRCGDIEVVF